MSGLKEYSPDLVRLEAQFSPETQEERRQVLAAENPFVRSFEYADQTDYRLVSVRPEGVSLTLYSCLGGSKWHTVLLSDLLAKAA